MPISGIKNSAKKETFGSKLNFSIGGTLLKPPISKSSILILSLGASKGISQVKFPIKVSLNLIFSLQFDGDLGSRRPMKTHSNPHFPWHFQGYFSSQIPNQSQFEFDIFPAILWGFGGAEAQIKLVWTQIPFDIAKGISQAKTPIKVRSNLIFSLKFYGYLGEQKPNENLLNLKLIKNFKIFSVLHLLNNFKYFSTSNSFLFPLFSEVLNAKLC